MNSCCSARSPDPEMAMLDIGMNIEPGSGVAAAQSTGEKLPGAKAQGRERAVTRHRPDDAARVVFLDRASLKANMRPFAFPAEYIEHPKTAVEQIVARLARRRGRDHQ